MTTFTRSLSALAATALLGLAGCASQAPLGPEEVTDFKLGETRNVHVFGDFMTAGQPSVAALEEARELGVRTVFNIRKEAEMEKVDFDEAAEVSRLGMTYVHLPWSGVEELTDARLATAREILSDMQRPILFHCASANRVGAMWAAWRTLDEGVEWEQALAEGRSIGLRSDGYVKRVTEYVAARQSNEEGE